VFAIINGDLTHMCLGNNIVDNAEQLLSIALLNREISGLNISLI
jgi:hypothetical protein